MWALLATLARADELDARIELYDAMLAEAAWGDLDTAIAAYRRLSRNVGERDPAGTDALYWLGNALDQLDQPEEAREALVGGISSGRCTGCRDLLERISIDGESVTSVPVRWSFDDANHGFFHPWTVQDTGSIRLAPGPKGDPSLEWTSNAQARRPDQLVVGFRHPSPAPHTVRFELTATGLTAILQVWAQDDDGRTWTLPEPVVIEAGQRRAVTIALSALIPEDGGPPLEPAALSRLTLVDLTGTRGSGPHTLWIDDFEVR